MVAFFRFFAKKLQLFPKKLGNFGTVFSSLDASKHIIPAHGRLTRPNGPPQRR